MAKKVKICYLAFSEKFLAPDGGFRHIYSVCSQLTKQGDEIHLFTKGLGKNIQNKRVLSISDGRFYVYQVDFPISPFFIGILSFLKGFPRLVITLIKTIKQEKIEIIHQRFWIPIGAGIFVAKLLGIPYILDVNAPFVEEVFYKKRVSWLYKLWRKAVFKAADAIITTTTVLRNIVARDTKKEKILVVRQGVDLNTFKSNPSLEKKLKEKYKLDSKLIILFVGAFRPWQGVADLIKTSPYVLEQFPNARFLFVGGTKKGIAFAKQLGTSLKIDSSLVFTGPVNFSEIPSYIALSDVTVAPFNLEDYPPLKELGFWWGPIKIFEYAYLGKPIVTIGAGELPFYVPNNVAGLLYRSGNVQELAEKIKMLLRDVNLRNVLGTTGKQRVERNFTWQRAAQLTRTLYHTLLHKK